jgi:hypothetical protein
MKKECRDLPGSTNKAEDKQLNFSCSNLNNLVLVPRGFWKDLDDGDFEYETECINRLDREEEYLNGLGRDGHNRSGCIQTSTHSGINLSYEYKQIILSSKLWKDFRNLIITSRKRCQYCGTQFRVLGQVEPNIHHLSYNGFYSYFNPENVLALCRSCHIEAHKRLRRW